MTFVAYSRFELYERCVQSPADAVSLIIAAHDGRPRILGEDFSGTAAVSAAWVATDPERRAIACDLDAEALARADADPRVTTILGDVTSNERLASARADAIFVGNFSIGYLHTRAALVAYLRRCRDRLRPLGVLVLDTYGGASAFLPGAVERRIPLGAGSREVRSTFERISADPATGMVENALHFRVFEGREVVQELTSAFTYRWRLWSIPELADALCESGLEPPRLHWSVPAPPSAPASTPPWPADNRPCPWPADWAVALSARARTLGP